jgi:DnaK suppressor protein
MPAKKPAAKSKKASKPAKTVVKKVTPAKKAAQPKPSAARVVNKRVSVKPVVKKSNAVPKTAVAAPKAAVSKTKSAIPVAKPKATPPAPAKVAAKPAARVQEKPQAKGPAVVTAVAEKSAARQKLQPVAPAADADDAEYPETGRNLLAGPRNVQPYIAKRGEQYMGKEQLNHFRQILANWKRDLMEEVDRTVHHMKDEAANFPDPNDRATQESEFSLELRTRDRERKLIRKIDEALKRIEDGSYGYCNETGEEIGVKRLEARPVATLSVEAQERRERREKQYGDRDDRYR